ncbi:hypothetical protein P43SY_006696 [Pythium insidiosum]|uniref:Anamorsin homolog n=1 Tax=Pythium insidiosum TaxID=114742 RepID=A0AAD5QAN7_PYTIN|nr:hypothetical protein P43SY_006696 [Pythium insidiosum]
MQLQGRIAVFIRLVGESPVSVLQDDGTQANNVRVLAVGPASGIADVIAEQLKEDETFDGIVAFNDDASVLESDIALLAPRINAGGDFQLYVTDVNEDNKNSILMSLMIGGFVETIVDDEVTDYPGVPQALRFVSKKPAFTAAAIPLNKSSTSAQPLKKWTVVADEFDGVEDEDMIDEDTLLDDTDKVLQAAKDDCEPGKDGKRRACKNCTCGRKDELDQPVVSDNELQQMVSSCGNCFKGDAFRCGSCPFLGKPAFKPGMEKVLLNLDDSDDLPTIQVAGTSPALTYAIVPVSPLPKVDPSFTIAAMLARLVAAPLHWIGLGLMSADMVVRLCSTFEFWYLSAWNLSNGVIMGAILRDWRAIIVFFATIGCQFTLFMDANIYVRKLEAQLIFAAGPTVLSVLVCIVLQITPRTRFTSVMIHENQITDIDLLMSGILVLSFFLTTRIIWNRMQFIREELTRRRLGVRVCFIALVNACMLVHLVLWTYWVYLADGRSRRNRVLLDTAIWGVEVRVEMLSFAAGKILAAFLWGSRMLWRVTRTPGDSLVVIQRFVRYPAPVTW